MCQGDDLNCPHFKLHYEKFKEGLDIERRSLLRSGVFAGGGAAALGAFGGL